MIWADEADHVVNMVQPTLEAGVVDGPARLVAVVRARADEDAHRADDAALGGQRLDLVVGQVAGVAAYGAAVRVGANDRCVGDFEHVPEALVVRVRQVDDHAQTVQLPDHGLAKGREAALRSRLEPTVRTQVTAEPGHEHLSVAEPIEDAQHLQRIADQLHAVAVEHHPHLAVTMRADDVFRSGHEDQVVDRVDLAHEDLVQDERVDHAVAVGVLERVVVVRIWWISELAPVLGPLALSTELAGDIERKLVFVREVARLRGAVEHALTEDVQPPFLDRGEVEPPCAWLDPDLFAGLGKPPGLLAYAASPEGSEAPEEAGRVHVDNQGFPGQCNRFVSDAR